MPITVETTDTFEQWRVKTNLLSVNVELSANVITSNIGNLSQLVTITKSNIVAAINETQLVANILGGKAFFTTSVRGLGANNTADSQSFGVKGETRGSGNAGVIGSNLDRNTTGYIGHYDYGVYGENGSVGVIGVNTGSNVGVRGYNSSANTDGYLGTTSYSVYGNGGLVSVFGITQTPGNIGVKGYNTAVGTEGYLGYPFYGVYGLGGTYGVYGIGTTAGNVGVRGYNSIVLSNGFLGHPYYGVYGQVYGAANAAVFGENVTTNGLGYLGVSGYGVLGYGATLSVANGGSVGVGGFAAAGSAGGSNAGVTGKVTDSLAQGWLGYSAYGVYGFGPTGMQSLSIGVYGTAAGSITSSNAGVRGVNTTTNADGYLGYKGAGVYGFGGTSVSAGNSIGVYGNVTGSANIAVAGYNQTSGKYAYLGYSTYAVYASGNIYSTDDIIAASDRRLKDNIVTIPNALNTVCALRGVKYNLKSTNAAKIGMIAQEVEPVVPEVVDTQSEYWGISYPNLVGLLVEAIKELKQEIDELKKG